MFEQSIGIEPQSARGNVVSDQRQNIETEAISHLRMRNLMELSESELEKLKTEIRACRETAQIWVHSHTGENLEPAEGKEEEYQLYISGRERMLKLLPKAKMPIIVLIESNPIEDQASIEIKNYQNIYSKYCIEGQKTVYYVRTFKGAGVPALVDCEDKTFSNPETIDKNWDLVASKLKEIGAKNIIVRGRFLSESSSATVEEFNEYFPEFKKEYLVRHPEIVKPISPSSSISHVHIPNGCVGNTIVNLDIRGFNIRPSKVTQFGEV